MFDAKENKTDLELVMDWKKGDQGAAEELLTRYRPLIISLAKRAHKTVSFEDEEQDLVLAFLTKVKAYDPTTPNAHFAGYIAQGLRWASLDHYRKAKNIADHEELTSEIPEMGGAVDVYGAGDTSYLQQAAETAHLTRKQTAFFKLWMKGKSAREIQETLGIQASSQTRMKANIRGRLQQHKKEIAKWLLD